MRHNAVAFTFLAVVLAVGVTERGWPAGYEVELRANAERGDSFSQATLGHLALRSGNHAEAARWWRRAADQGDAPSQYNLAGLYRRGEGVKQDYSEALRLYLKAAAQRFSGAEEALGDMYRVGQGVRQNYTEAQERWLKAANGDSDSAAYKLGILYATGEGVLQDYVRAHMWFNIAATLAAPRNGSWSTPEYREKYVKARDTVGGAMTPEQIAEAQALARDWMKKHEGK